MAIDVFGRSRLDLGLVFSYIKYCKASLALDLINERKPTLNFALCISPARQWREAIGVKPEKLWVESWSIPCAFHLFSCLPQTNIPSGSTRQKLKKLQAKKVPTNNLTFYTYGSKVSFSNWAMYIVQPWTFVLGHVQFYTQEPCVSNMCICFSFKFT